MGEKGKIKNIILNILFVGVLLYLLFISLASLIQINISKSLMNPKERIVPTIIFLIAGFIIIFTLIRFFSKRKKMNKIMAFSRLIVAFYPLTTILISLLFMGPISGGGWGPLYGLLFLVFSNLIIVIISLITFIISSYKKDSPKKENIST